MISLREGRTAAANQKLNVCQIGVCVWARLSPYVTTSAEHLQILGNSEEGICSLWSLFAPFACSVDTTRLEIPARFCNEVDESVLWVIHFQPFGLIEVLSVQRGKCLLLLQLQFQSESCTHVT